MTVIQYKRLIFLTVLLSAVWLLFVQFASSSPLLSYLGNTPKDITLFLILTPFAGLLYSIVFISSLKHTPIFRSAVFVLLSSLVAMLTPWVFVSMTFEWLDTLSTCFGPFMLFAVIALLGCCYLHALIRYVLAINVSLRQQITSSLLASCCSIPVGIGCLLTTTGNTNLGGELVLDHWLFALEPAIWWIGFSVGLSYPLKIEETLVERKE